MQATTSHLRRTHPAWCWLCPIQSRGQLLSIAVIFVLALPAMAWAGHAVDPAMPLPGLLMSSVAGAMPAIYAVLPGRLDIVAATDTRELAPGIVQFILAANYVHSTASEGTSRFIPRGPRWMRWDENTLTLRVLDDRTVRVDGPLLMLYATKRWLERARPARAV
jgi:hypothetical protein